MAVGVSGVREEITFDRCGMTCSGRARDAHSECLGHTGRLSGDVSASEESQGERKRDNEQEKPNLLSQETNRPTA